MSGLNEAAGVEMLTRAQSNQPFAYQLGESVIHSRGETRFTLRTTRAEVLAHDVDGNPVLTHAPYGKGHVYLLTHPLELEQTLTPGAFQSPGAYRVYETISTQARVHRIGRKTSPLVGLTEHSISPTERILVLINYGEQDVQTPFALAPGWQIDHAFYGHPGSLPARDALVLKARKTPEG